MLINHQVHIMSYINKCLFAHPLLKIISFKVIIHSVLCLPDATLSKTVPFPWTSRVYWPFAHYTTLKSWNDVYCWLVAIMFTYSKFKVYIYLTDLVVIPSFLPPLLFITCFSYFYSVVLHRDIIMLMKHVIKH